MEWATLYVYSMTYMGLFSAFISTALRGHMAWRQHQKESFSERSKHVIIDALLGALIGALFPAFTCFILYSYCFDPDLIYNKLM